MMTELSVILYTSLCSLSMRLLQHPANWYFNGSGFPIPVNGSRSISRIKSPILKAVFGQ